MSYLERNIQGLDKITERNTPGPRLMGADWPIGMNVYNPRGEKLGNIKEVVLDVDNGSVAYAVLSFGGFFGIDDKLFAIPWSVLTLKLETLDKRFILDAEREYLQAAPGFDKDNWPDTADESWLNQVHSYETTSR